jgi:hypothetical protein
MPIELWDYDTKGPPPSLNLLIGLPVIWAGLANPPALLILFERLALEVTPIASVGVMSLNVRVGSIAVGADWRELDRHVEKTPHMLALRGMIFTGMDGPVLEFGDDHGVRFHQDGTIQFVRAPRRP